MQSSSFLVIWYYWYKSYIQTHDESFQSSLQNINNLSQKLHMQSVQQSIINIMKQNAQKYLLNKINQNSQKQNIVSIQTPNKHQLSFKNSNSLIYLIDPVKQLRNFQLIIRKYVPLPQKQQMLSQLFSYYINQRNGYLIGHQAEIFRQIQLIKEKDQQYLQGKGDSIVDSFEKIENKIDQLQLGNKIGQFDGIQLLNCKYKDIPHTFVRIKKNSYIKCLQLGAKIRLNPCQPRTVGNLPILPRLNKLRPSPNKIQIFGNYIEQLSKHYPTFSPSIDSIYQYNNVPYVFVHEDGGWECDRLFPMLCYYVGYGNSNGQVSQKMVDLWIKQNKNSLLSKVVDRIRKIRNRHQKAKTEVEDEKIGVIINLDQRIW